MGKKRGGTVKGSDGGRNRSSGNNSSNNNNNENSSSSRRNPQQQQSYRSSSSSLSSSQNTVANNLSSHQHPSSSFTSSSSSYHRRSSSSWSWTEWVHRERNSLTWILGCAVLGMSLGFGIGTGHLTGAYGTHSPWRNALAGRIRSSAWFNLFTPSFRHRPPRRNDDSSHHNPHKVHILDRPPWIRFLGWAEKNYRRWTSSNHNAAARGRSSSSSSGSDRLVITRGRNREQRQQHQETIARMHQQHHGSSSADLTFAVLRESVIREEGGFVHPDLGFLRPAPSGAVRGLGMVRDDYSNCQTRCFAATATLSYDDDEEENDANVTRAENDEDLRNTNTTAPPRYPQESVLIRVPLSAQIDRSVALRTILPLLPPDVRHRSPPEELDDAALLALFLAHERHRGRDSRYRAYVASLAPRDEGGGGGRHPPTCGRRLSPDHPLGALADARGWPAAVARAADHADRIAGGLARDYGPHVFGSGGHAPASASRGSAFEALRWALCAVASRATRGRRRSARNGETPDATDATELRLVPVIDLLNHDGDAGEVVELTEEEDGEHAGAMVVRSTRHGRHRPLRKGQELLINYNVPEYGPLDWFLNMGFVPRERLGGWTRLEPAWPGLVSDAGGATTLSGGVRVTDPSRPEL